MCVVDINKNVGVIVEDEINIFGINCLEVLYFLEEFIVKECMK